MQQASEPGLRERKKKATAEAICRATRDLVLEHGLDSVTVEQICEQVDISVRTFFNYFDSKEQAILGSSTDIGTPALVSEFLAGGPSGDLLSDLLNLLNPATSLTEQGREDFQKAWTIADREPRVLASQLARIAQLEDQIAEMVATRVGRDRVDPASRTTAAIAMTLIRRACFDWFHTADSDFGPYLDAAHQTLILLSSIPAASSTPKASSTPANA